jgi:hypothetical protein
MGEKRVRSVGEDIVGSVTSLKYVALNPVVGRTECRNSLSSGGMEVYLNI